MTSWESVARTLAILVAAGFTLIGTLFLLAWLFFEPRRGRFRSLLELAYGTAYIYGVPTLAILYLLRPYPHGFTVLIAAMVVPWIIAAAVQAVRRDPIYARHVQWLVDEHVVKGVPGSFEPIRTIYDRRGQRMVVSAVLDHCRTLQDDVALERAVTALGRLTARRKRRLECVKDILHKTRDDPDRARLHDAARSAIEAINRH